MSVLDQILDRHASGPEVIHEEHDITKINWVAGLSDPGEMIACGYLPEIRRQDGEQDDAYQTRITPIVMQLPFDVQSRIMKSAINRAGLDLSNGRVNAVYANELPWTKLGVVVRGELRSQVALDKGGLDFNVVKKPLFYANGEIGGPNTQYTQDPGSYALVREDTGARLGSAGSGYQVIQNREAFGFLDKLLEQYGATYESAGSLHGGQKIWLLAHMPKQAFTVNGSGDAIDPYVAFFNGHTGNSGCAWCYPTGVRIVCNNTLTLSLSKDKAKGIKIAHRGSIKGKLVAAQDALGMAAGSFQVYKEQAETLYRKPMNVQGYANGVLDLVLKVTEAQALAGADVLAAAIAETQAVQDFDALRRKCERDIEHRSEILDDILDRYNSNTCDGIRGTAWGTFNAFTEYADHNKLGRYNKNDTYAQQTQRFESTLLGTANDMKQTALEYALSV